MKIKMNVSDVDGESQIVLDNLSYAELEELRSLLRTVLLFGIKNDNINAKDIENSLSLDVLIQAVGEFSV